ncbi:hypothetical protein CRG98_020777 [Punica granatum]|uniref:Uncharacterized protein n=1 Tax=Punica granatum TaxID=22663 RepID=A0A2I0JR52_PUNGR|nr:hypothetical protein CRG98_020777 [Punica granatum]
MAIRLDVSMRYQFIPSLTVRALPSRRSLGLNYTDIVIIFVTTPSSRRLRSGPQRFEPMLVRSGRIFVLHDSSNRPRGGKSIFNASGYHTPVTTKLAFNDIGSFEFESSKRLESYPKAICLDVSTRYQSFLPRQFERPQVGDPRA